MARPAASSRPLLSAALIVRDEQDVLDRCLASLVGVVDEIVVLDTGSTDRTVQIARARGARVIEGGWYDDFGRSRNEVLGHCLGRWALVIDADEALRIADVGRLKRLLRGAGVDAFQVAVDSFSDDAGTVGVTHQSIRLLRRGRTRYEGRLHEQVRSSRGGRQLTVGLTDLVTLAHWGYIQRVLDQRAKTERNIRISERAIAEGAGLRGQVDLGRTLAAAGRHEEALERFAAARDADDGFVVRTAHKQAIQSLLKLGRPDQALGWVDGLRAASTRPGTPDLFEARVRTMLGEIDRAAQLYGAHLDGDVVGDDDGLDCPTVKVRTDLAEALLDAGRHRDGLEHLLLAAAHGSVKTWPRLVRTLHEVGEVDRAAALLDLTGDPEHCRLVLAELAARPVEGLSELVAALHQRHPDQPVLIAFAPLVAEQLSLEQSVTWAARARAAGLDAHCPLVTRATGDVLGLRDRLVSAGLLVELYGDRRGCDLVEAIAATMPPDGFYEALHVLDELAPAALEPFVVSAAHDTARCVAMAEALDAHGEREVAANVLQFGLDQRRGGHVEPGDDVLDRAAQLLTRWEAA